jgi:phage gp29-like protein
VLLRPAQRPAPPPADRAGPQGGGAPATLSAASALADDAPHDSFDDATLQVLNDLGWKPDVTALQAALAKCTTAEEGRAVLRQFVDKLGTETLADALARSRFVSRLAGDTGA